MDESKVIALEKPGEDERDALTAVLRQGAWRMLAQTVEEEVEAFVAAHEHIRDAQGRRLVIRNGYLPERTIQTGIGDIAVRVPRARDRSGSDIRFTSSILPPYLRRSKSIEAFIVIFATLMYQSRSAIRWPSKVFRVGVIRQHHDWNVMPFL